MSVVHVMQVAIHQVIHMASVRYRFVPATCPMHVPRFMPAALMPARAIGRILRRHRQNMLVKVPFMRMMQMPVVQIVDVPFMLNRRMPAPGPVNV